MEVNVESVLRSEDSTGLLKGDPYTFKLRFKRKEGCSGCMSTTHELLNCTNYELSRRQLCFPKPFKLTPSYCTPCGEAGHCVRLCPRYELLRRVTFKAPEGRMQWRQQFRTPGQEHCHVREMNKNLERFHVYEDGLFWLTRVFYLIDAVYAALPSDTDVYRFIFTRLDSDMQKYVYASKSVVEGDFNSLIKFIAFQLGVGPKIYSLAGPSEILITRDNIPETITRVEMLVDTSGFIPGVDLNEAQMRVRDEAVKREIMKRLNPEMIILLASREAGYLNLSYVQLKNTLLRMAFQFLWE